MFLGLLDHLQIFSQLYLIELLRLLTCLGLLKLWHFIYPRLLTKFAMLVFFINLSLMEFQVRNLVSLLFFSVIHSFEWFWIESLHKNIQLMLEFLKAPFWLLHFLRYINDLPNDVICDIAMLMIQLSVLSVIRHLFCRNNLNWLLNLNLIYKTLLTGVRLVAK